MSAEYGGKEGALTLHVGSCNGSGRLSDNELGWIEGVISSNGVAIYQAGRAQGMYRGIPEDSYEVLVNSSRFENIFNAAQEIRKHHCQQAIGLSNSRRQYLRITEEAFLCSGVTVILHSPALCVKAGAVFDPRDEGFRLHKDYYVFTDMECHFDGMTYKWLGYLPQRLSKKLDSWELYKLTPLGKSDFPCPVPEWIDAVYPINEQQWIVWHPQGNVEEGCHEVG